MFVNKYYSDTKKSLPENSNPPIGGEEGNEDWVERYNVPLSVSESISLFVLLIINGETTEDDIVKPTSVLVAPILNSLYWFFNKKKSLVKYEGLVTTWNSEVTMFHILPVENTEPVIVWLPTKVFEPKLANDPDICFLTIWDIIC